MVVNNRTKETREASTGNPGGGERPVRTRFTRPRAHRRECEFTANGILPDYKDVKRLQRYLTPQGKILPRRRTGITAKMQRRLATAIKRARILALLPMAPAHTRN